MVRLALAAVAAVFALMFAGMALWFLGESLVLALEAVPLSPAVSMLITGGVGLVLAVLIALTAKGIALPRRRPATATAPTGSGVNDLAVQLGGMIAEKFASATRSHPFGTIGGALAAGLAVGAVPELRKLIMDLINRR